MNLNHTPEHRDIFGLSTCDDTHVSHRPPSDKPIRIILADDHPVVLTGVEMVLAGLGFSVVAKARNADELLQHLERTPCDLMISDYSMPDGQFPDGLALMGYLKRHYRACPLIVITMLRNASMLRALLNAGVNGLFDKRSPLTELKQAVLGVTLGRRYACPAFLKLVQGQSLAATGSDDSRLNLSERELEVVRLFVRGMSGREIAAQLNRSEKTISRQKRTAMDKLGLGHDGGLVEFARLNGLRG
ncbi:response regulator transcription factor [Pseudomonas sp. T1.Ur]|uniref:response regulator transcription factor n=1 Tax=Pseudomonas sp. T1.Ur TaxID=2928704 RepID=UPI00201E1FCB|nr:response regulator transcription factor [Pseudomonas sp. T1.Ur]MCL6703287.1 response regulator transcription factor [Pseudomonas sp. T1.Ur]